MTEKDPFSGCSLTEQVSPSKMQVICMIDVQDRTQCWILIRQTVQQYWICAAGSKVDTTRRLHFAETNARQDATPVIEIYLQNPTQGSTATNVAVQVVYDRNVGGGNAHRRGSRTAAGVLYLSVLEALSCSIRNVTIAADLRHAPNTGPTVQ